MTVEQVELLRRTYADWARGDFSGGPRLADDAQFIPLDDLTDVERVRGAESIRRFLRELFEAFSELRIEAHEFVDEGDRVLVRVTQHVTGTASGARGEYEYWMEWAFDEAGDVTRFGAVRGSA